MRAATRTADVVRDLWQPGTSVMNLDRYGPGVGAHSDCARTSGSRRFFDCRGLTPFRCAPWRDYKEGEIYPQEDRFHPGFLCLTFCRSGLCGSRAFTKPDREAGEAEANGSSKLTEKTRPFRSSDLGRGRVKKALDVSPASGLVVRCMPPAAFDVVPQNSKYKSLGPTKLGIEARIIHTRRLLPLTDGRAKPSSRRRAAPVPAHSPT